MIKTYNDYWADFCTHHARMQAWMQEIPYKDITKERATFYLNWMVHQCLEGCTPESKAQFTKLFVRSKSVTWRSLAQRMEALCDLCIMPRG
jgi:hypothetical protein